MPFKDVSEFLNYLDSKQELLHIEKEVDPKFEVAAIIRKLDREKGRAVLFEKVRGFGKGTDARIVGNILGTRRRLALALDLDQEKDIRERYERGRKNTIPPRMVSKRAPVQEVVVAGAGSESRPEILKTLPVATYHQGDASPYISCGIVVARHPENKMICAGIHRIQIKGRDKLGAFLHSPPVGEAFARAEERNRPLEVAIVIGVEPVTLFASALSAPSGPDKFSIAGGLRGAPVDLVRGRTVDVDYPANSEVVIEGEVLPKKREPEGPFGENTGYYMKFSSAVIKVKCIMHRRGFLFQALVPWTDETTVMTALGRESDILSKLKSVVPSVTDVSFSPSSIGMKTIIQISDKRSESEPRVALYELLATNPWVKHAIAVDDDVDIHDEGEVDWALCTRFRPDRDLVMLNGLQSFAIDPSSGDAMLTSKLGFDATKPMDAKGKFDKIAVPLEVARAVEANWDKYVSGK